MRLQVTKIDLNNKCYGGRVYENQVVDLLHDEVEFRRVFLLKYRPKFFNVLRIVYIFLKYRFFYSGILMLTNQTTWLTGLRSRNIIVIHHLDSSNSRSLSSIYQNFCERSLLANRRRYVLVVAVAHCWEEQLRAAGFPNVRVIYNSFNPELFHFSEDAVRAFRIKHGFTDRPLIYLGNCLRKKGVVEAYDVLKDMDADFVTSGNVKDVELPVTNLSLSFEDYRLLLASADVVLTMSKFKEGWNRTAHEAVLCGTPVIGSGTGGMGELLRMSGQLVCKEFSHLPELVDVVLRKSKPVDSTPLSRFDLNYFRNKWLEALRGVANS